MDELMIKIENVSKQYRLGQIGGTTLRDELQRKRAKILGKEDPTKSVIAKDETSGATFLALEGISFDVKKGERVGIIGHNGAGKSTLLKLLSRVTAPSKGMIGLNGRVASMLEVGTGFHGELTGRENIYMNGAILGMTKKEIDSKIDDIIEFSECSKFIDTPVKRYSSGMYVKLAFAVAAHLDSEILVMDEVLAVGDMKFQKKCLGKMDDVSKNVGKTVLYVSHNMSTIRTLCNRCIVLDHGKLIYDGEVNKAIEIYSDCQKQTVLYNDFTSIKRNTPFDIKLEFLSLQILVDETHVFHTGETIPVKIKCKANSDFEKIKIRFEIIAMDGTVVGTMLSDQAISEKKGKVFSLNVEIETAHIVPGNYRFDMLSYEYNEYGAQRFFDRIEGAMYLTLENNPAEELLWLPQFWGRIHLDDIKIMDVIE